MKGIHTVKELLRRVNYMVTIDLKDAYFAIMICTQHRKPAFLLQETELPC